MRKLLQLSASVMFVLSLSTVQAADWTRFRGPSGNGVATDAESLPSTWSPTANLEWKTELPGPGASSPIIVGDRAFVTCYSGYGLSQESPGDLEDLVRHLVCVDLKSGEKIWQRDVPVSMPEDAYSGIGVTAHGYASHTPVSDGKNVYAFFGKSGVHAFDFDGNKLWNADVGKESDPNRWGSSSSPIVYKNIVIVTASAESQSIIGFDKESGKELWRQEAKGLDGMWGTPTLVDIDGERTELVMCVAKEMWGMDPLSGDLLWFADATGAQQAYASVVLDGKRIFAFTGRGGGSIAVDAGGSGNVSESNTVWTGRDSSSFASPVRHEDKIYNIARNILTVIDAKSGERLEQIRLRGALETGGRFGSLDYPSPVVAGGRLYYLNGSGQMYVFDLGEKTEQIALNRFTSDTDTFWGSPAISGGRMVVRSAKNLYCVTDRGETVDQDASLLAKADDAEASPPTDAQAGGRGGPGGRGAGGRGGPGGGGPGGPGGRGAGGRGGPGGRFDPAAMFNGMDGNQDGFVSEDELEGNRMAERLKTLDKDEDGKISKEEFTTGITSLFSRGGGGGGGGNYGRRGQDNRPERPQRPAMKK